MFDILPNNHLFLILFAILFALTNFIGITIFYKLFGKTGLFVWIGFGTVLANIQVQKFIDIDFLFLNFTATLGNLMYGTLFLATDAISEKYGPREAKKAVWLGFLTLIATVIVMQMALIFEPSVSDSAQGALERIFGFMPRIALGSLVAYIISQYLDVTIFHKIKEKYSSDKLLWLRNNGSTLISQFVDTVIFITIAFLGAEGVSMDIWIDILWTTYFLKVLVAALDTPFIYWIKRINPIEG